MSLLSAVGPVGVDRLFFLCYTTFVSNATIWGGSEYFEIV